MTSTHPGLRERTRRAVRAELVAVAVDLFLAQGFDATTTEQIAAAAGVSRRSFFRYFASKEDVLTQAMQSAGETIAARLAQRPAHELPWTAMRRALDELVEQMASDNHALAISRMIMKSSTSRSGHQNNDANWLQAIAMEMQPRLSTQLCLEDVQVQATAIVGAALACLHTAESAWAASDGKRQLPALLDAAMSAVAPIAAPTGPS